MPSSDENNLRCPLPINDYPDILLAHGGGGRLMHQLIDRIFAAAFDNEVNKTRHDSVVLNLGKGKVAFTTDSFVVNPLFFPGGDIGTLAINGTVNDLAMSGAKPQYLSAGFILEEGLPTETLWRVAQSMRQAADEAGVKVVTGDTKVVERGRGHGLYINTAGVGVIEHDMNIGPQYVKDEDAVILSGDVGRHGIAILAEREGLSFETQLKSDCAPLAQPVMALIKAGIEIHCFRDLTRGGLATALVEIAKSSNMKITVRESDIAVCEKVRGACELLGYDPLYVANEGRFIAIVPEKDKGKTLEILKSFCAQAAMIGRVVGASAGLVTLKGGLGAERVLDMLSGEQLPRIC
jgi:hydrogenase expression/formation protein HypE